LLGPVMEENYTFDEGILMIGHEKKKQESESLAILDALVFRKCVCLRVCVVVSECMCLV
jgi:hypothetical protein